MYETSYPNFIFGSGTLYKSYPIKTFRCDKKYDFTNDSYKNGT